MLLADYMFVVHWPSCILGAVVTGLIFMVLDVIWFCIKLSWKKQGMYKGYDDLLDGKTPPVVDPFAQCEKGKHQWGKWDSYCSGYQQRDCKICSRRQTKGNL